MTPITRQGLADGINPKRVRDDKRRVSQMTFPQCATACIAALAPQWSNAQHRYQWEQTIPQYANPVIGHSPSTKSTRTISSRFWNLFGHCDG